MKTFYKGNTEYFPSIGKIAFEGPGSDNPMAFKFYNEDKMIGDKSMKEHLRFAACYWHTFCSKGSDPFGGDTQSFEWDNATDEISAAKQKQDAAFEFFTKLGVPYWCFHDIDLAPDADDVIAYEKNLTVLVERAKGLQSETSIKLLWGTANVFSHPRYMNGASTNPDFAIVARAAAQVKNAIDATIALGGENYVFWGGREGYQCLLNTNTKRELDHMGEFLRQARDYGRANGFKGTYLIEPKPMEPSYHQYDVDAQTVIGFLREQDLAADFKLNIEGNHATLAGHSFAHDLQMATDAGMLGSIDANRGNPQNGWDTDQFPTDIYDTTQAMLVVLEAGGLGEAMGGGGLNFDAKVRRESIDMEDIFHGHIGGMDAFARGLEVAHALLNDSRLPQIKKARYASFDGAVGADFEAGKIDLAQLRDIAASNPNPKNASGKQEMIENLLNQYMINS